MHCRWATVKFRERLTSCDAAPSAQSDFNSYIVENSHLSGGAEIDALRHSHRHVTDAIKPDGHLDIQGLDCSSHLGLAVVEINDRSAMHHDREARKYGVELACTNSQQQSGIDSKKKEGEAKPLPLSGYAGRALSP